MQSSAGSYIVERPKGTNRSSYGIMRGRKGHVGELHCRSPNRVGTVRLKGVRGGYPEMRSVI